MYVIQTEDDSGHLYGAEYLELYKKIDTDRIGTLAAFNPGTTIGTPLRNL
jgi:hypothetical protein